jgi:hypothetical protein
MTSAKALMCVNLVILLIVESSALLCKQGRVTFRYAAHTPYVL